MNDEHNIEYPYLSYEHLDRYSRMITSRKVKDRCRAADNKFGLDTLSDDPIELVRIHVVRKGYNLDKFVHDPSFLVREEVAKQGYALDVLSMDIEPSVRSIALEMARKHSESWHIENLPIITKCNTN